MSNRFTFKNLNLKVDNLGIQRTRLSLVPSMGLSIIKEPNKTYYEIGALVNNELTELRVSLPMEIQFKLDSRQMISTLLS